MVFINIKKFLRNPFKRITNITIENKIIYPEIRDVHFGCLSCGQYMGFFRSIDKHQPFEIYLNPLCRRCFAEKVGHVSPHMQPPPNFGTGINGRE